MPNKAVPTTLDEIVRRARSVLNEGKYILGAGGRVPSAATPFDPTTGGCDCSGFVAWCCGVDRYQPADRGGIDGDYVETSAIVADALHANEQKLFVGIQRDRRAGHIIVYGDVWQWDVVDGQRKYVKKSEGHVGIISEVDSRGAVTKVIHCSMGNYRTFRVAVAETDPAVFFKRNWITVKFKGATA
jgi:hypothetical protein